MCQMFSWRLKGLIQEMKAFKEFRREDKAFWFFIRFISERLGYTNRKTSSINVYTFEQIDALCNKENIDVSVERINKAVLYCRMRADVINNIIRNNLMTAEFMTNFLVMLSKQDNFDDFKNSMATPGVGTLSNRMLYFHNNLRAKTGTLSNVSAIAGYIKTQRGREVAFSVMINDPKSSSNEKKQIEEAVLRAVYTAY